VSYLIVILVGERYPQGVSTFDVIFSSLAFKKSFLDVYPDLRMAERSEASRQKFIYFSK